jgi:DNA-directed RNA polymerase sigma subunit (sigma70/sigma32)
MKIEQVEASHERIHGMLQMREQGATFRAISDRYGVTHERVRQILLREERYCRRADSASRDLRKSRKALTSAPELVSMLLAVAGLS